jgi:hypothetical protein
MRPEKEGSVGDEPGGPEDRFPLILEVIGNCPFVKRVKL